MRSILAGVVAVLVAWGAYVGSPYYVLYRLARAVESGDGAEVARRVNVRALRVSLAKQLAAELAAAAPPGSGISSSDAQLAAATALALADPLLDTVTAPAGIVQLLRGGAVGPERGTLFGDRRVAFDDLDDFLGASSWRGFRNVYFMLPPGAPPAARYRLQLRLGRLAWRLVSLELPPETRRRLAAGFVRRLTP